MKAPTKFERSLMHFRDVAKENGHGNYAEVLHKAAAIILNQRAVISLLVSETTEQEMDRRMEVIATMAYSVDK